jgi:hypothetical protein
MFSPAGAERAGSGLLDDHGVSNRTISPVDALFVLRSYSERLTKPSPSTSLVTKISDSRRLYAASLRLSRLSVFLSRDSNVGTALFELSCADAMSGIATHSASPNCSLGHAYDAILRGIGFISRFHLASK